MISAAVISAQSPQHTPPLSSRRHTVYKVIPDTSHLPHGTTMLPLFCLLSGWGHHYSVFQSILRLPCPLLGGTRLFLDYRFHSLFVCRKMETFFGLLTGHRDSTKPGDLMVCFFMFSPPKVLHGPILATSSDTEKKKKNPFNCPRCQSPPLAFTAWQLCRWLR